MDTSPTLLRAVEFMSSIADMYATGQITIKNLYAESDRRLRTLDPQPVYRKPASHRMRTKTKTADAAADDGNDIDGDECSDNDGGDDWDEDAASVRSATPLLEANDAATNVDNVASCGSADDWQPMPAVPEPRVYALFRAPF